MNASSARLRLLAGLLVGDRPAPVIDRQEQGDTRERRKRDVGAGEQAGVLVHRGEVAGHSVGHTGVLMDVQDATNMNE